eukprot:314735_1
MKQQSKSSKKRSLDETIDEKTDQQPTKKRRKVTATHIIVKLITPTQKDPYLKVENAYHFRKYIGGAYTWNPSKKVWEKEFETDRINPASIKQELYLLHIRATIFNDKNDKKQIKLKVEGMNYDHGIEVKKSKQKHQKFQKKLINPKFDYKKSTKIYAKQHDNDATWQEYTRKIDNAIKIEENKRQISIQISRKQREDVFEEYKMLLTQWGARLKVEIDVSREFRNSNKNTNDIEPWELSITLWGFGK